MKKIATLLMCLTLNACSTHQQFDCPYQDGSHCLNVGEIDQKINNGEIGEAKTKPKAEKSCWKFCTASKKKNNPEIDNVSNPSPLRTPETILSLWVAPFYSSDGTYHEAQRLHFVAKEASWRGVNQAIEEAIE